MRPGPRAVVEELLATLRLDAAPRPLDELVSDIIVQHPEWGYDAVEQSRVWTGKVYRLLVTRRDRDLERGRQPRFALNSSSSYMVQGPCFVEPRDPPEVAQQKRRRMRCGDYLAALRDAEPRQFEILCAKVLEMLGVQRAVVTPYRGDEGIDFYGRLAFADLVGRSGIYPVLEDRLVVWLVGEAKHYLHTKVATPDIRGLVGAAALGARRAFSRDGVHLDLRVRPCDPVVLLFFTTGEISSRGWSLCDRAGVVAMDGQMLAEYLADNDVAVRNAGGVPVFDRDRFAAWVGAA